MRPVLHVLAGVNGAGKSSIGGHFLTLDGLAWFNPDSFARELKLATRCDQETANAIAWHEGMRRLDEAIATRLNYAFETTLGGTTVTARILRAAKSHDVQLWFCGLASVELHIARVKRRIAAGGHPIPEAMIRERYPLAQMNLIKLMPHVAYIKVYDNTVEAADDGKVPDPLLVLEMDHRRVVFPAPDDLQQMLRAPDWAKSILEAAFRLGRRRPR